MPRIIPELRERLIEGAKRQLAQENDVTIRRLAQDCGTAVGTVYNYFPSKEALLAAVMMEDWLACCGRMRRDAAAEAGPLGALRAVTEALRAFAAQYAPVWRSYAGAKDSVGTLNLRHQQVVAEIASAVEAALRRFDVRGDRYLPEVLSELILYASRTDDGFDRIAGALEKILA